MKKSCMCGNLSKIANKELKAAFIVEKKTGLPGKYQVPHVIIPKLPKIIK